MVAAVGDIPPGDAQARRGRTAARSWCSISAASSSRSTIAVRTAAAASATAARPGSSNPTEPGHYCYSRQGEIIRCPWHGWEFDIRTGQSWCDPTRVRVRHYAVSVQPGTRLVAGPYVAETVPVTVEGDYVVIEA